MPSFKHLLHLPSYREIIPRTDFSLGRKILDQLPIVRKHLGSLLRPRLFRLRKVVVRIGERIGAEDSLDLRQSFGVFAVVLFDVASLSKGQ
jgi:hypothetical protein